jgi:hypothetical protein
MTPGETSSFFELVPAKEDCTWNRLPLFYECQHGIYHRGTQITATLVHLTQRSERNAGITYLRFIISLIKVGLMYAWIIIIIIKCIRQSK